jgi:hypothetical protein
MADYTKYNVEGLGENLNKRKLVFTVVKDYVEKNNPSFEDLQKAFPDELQGTRGVVKKESEVDDPKRFNMKEPLKIKNGMHVVVCNQWGNQIPRFIDAVAKLNYDIVPTNHDVVAIIDTNQFDPFQLNQQFSAYEGNYEMCDKLDEELEKLIEKDPKNIAFAKIFENLGYGYDYYSERIEKYFTLEEDPNDLQSILQEQSLISLLLSKHTITQSDVTSENTNFKLLFTSYLWRCIEVLIELNDEEILAEFIFSQSCRETDIEMDDNGDWLSDLTIDIIHYIFDINLASDDYEDGCTLHGNYFGSYVDSGYNYLSASRVLINSMI